MTDNYEIDANAITDFWSSAFMAMSSKWFETFAGNLSFPLNITDELVNISLEFTIAFSEYIKAPVPKILDIQFSVSDHSDPLIQIWKHSLSRLNSDAIAFIQWGQKQQEYKRLYIDFDWDRDILLIHWAGNPEQYAKLNLPDSLIDQLQLTILRNFVKYQRAKIHIHQAEQSPLLNNDEWSKFIFNRRKIGSWIANMTWLNTQISTWQDIFNLLSSEQLSILQAWAEAHIGKSMPSIIKLAKSLATVNE